MDAVIGADELGAVEERLGDGWDRNVHYRPPAGTDVETDTYRDELVMAGDNAPFGLEPHHVEWWRGNGDALRVSCVDRTYQLGGEGADGTVLDRDAGLDAAEAYLRQELGYEPARNDTETVV